MKLIHLVPTLALSSALSAHAETPRITNARMQARSAAAGLEREFRSLVAGVKDPAWIGYAVSATGRQSMCCWSSGDDCCGGCRLEGGRSFTGNVSSGGAVKLEPASEMLVLFRAADARVEKVRTFSSDCALDAGGLPFHWLTDVRPAESLKLLASFVEPASDGARESRRMADAALGAVAMHADPGADAVLDRFVGASQPESVRKKAAFWMGNARGRHGYETLRRLVREDKDHRFREHAVFALTQSHEPGAVEAIIEVARRDENGHVRGQALFWLAQTAGRKAEDAITRAIEDDPETEVKKKAVFALSQLPKDEGVPLLIQTARTNRNPAVRKQAMFWLGQSKDPRALAFFEEVLR
jgi:hypothetical protein